MNEREYIDDLFRTNINKHPVEARSHFEIVDPDTWRCAVKGKLGDLGNDWVGPYCFVCEGAEYEAYAVGARLHDSQKMFLSDLGVTGVENREVGGVGKEGFWGSLCTKLERHCVIYGSAIVFGGVIVSCLGSYFRLFSGFLPILGCVLCLLSGVITYAGVELVMTAVKPIRWMPRWASMILAIVLCVVVYLGFSLLCSLQKHMSVWDCLILIAICSGLWRGLTRKDEKVVAGFERSSNSDVTSTSRADEQHIENEAATPVADVTRVSAEAKEPNTADSRIEVRGNQKSSVPEKRTWMTSSNTSGAMNQTRVAGNVMAARPRLTGWELVVVILGIVLCITVIGQCFVPIEVIYVCPDCGRTEHHTLK